MKTFCDSIFKATLSMILCWACTFALPAQVLRGSEGFETDGEGIRYASNTFSDCAGIDSDFFLRTNSNPVAPPGCPQQFSTTLTGLQGSFFWVSEDIRTSTGCPGCRPPGQIQAITTYNIASFGSLQIRLHLACSNNSGSRWETSDSINVKTSIDGGPFRTVGRFRGGAAFGGNLTIDANLNGLVDDPIVVCDVANFTQYTFNIPGSGSTIRWQLDYDQQGGTEELAIDQIEIWGTVIVPVKWESFTGREVNETVKLDWVTTEETNVSHYIVERFSAANGYVPIGTVAAAGRPSSYTFVDPSPGTGAHFYRIQQVDVDNASSYSDAIEVHFSPTFKVSLFPNPMYEGCRLVIEGNAISGTMRIVDNMGRIVRTRIFENVNELQIDREGMAEGIYHLRLDLNNGKTLTQKLIVLAR